MNRFFAALFLFLLLTPGLGLLLSQESSESLEGVEQASTHRPSFSVRSFVKGSFQKQFTRWYKRSVGFWPELVRTDNQLNYWLFGIVSQNYESKVVVGKQGHLIERAYLKSASKIGTARPDRIEKRVMQIARLRSELQRRGKAFILLVSPNKPAMYPELIPNEYRIEGASDRRSNYELFLEYAERAGLPVLDGKALLEAADPGENVRHFATTGTHWNEYAACLISREIMQEVSRQLKIDYRLPACGPGTIRPLPAYADRDLVRLANLWYPESFYQKAIRPESGGTQMPATKQLHAVIVGTSFMWAILEHLDRNHAFQRREFLYYFKRWYRNKDREGEVMEKDTVDWISLLGRADLVLFEVNEAFTHKAGYGAAGAFVKTLKKSSE